jgi:hypothetical protein
VSKFSEAAAFNALSVFFFLYGFLIIHMILGGVAGIFASGVIREIKPVING